MTAFLLAEAPARRHPALSLAVTFGLFLVPAACPKWTARGLVRWASHQVGSPAGVDSTRSCAPSHTRASPRSRACFPQSLQALRPTRPASNLHRKNDLPMDGPTSHIMTTYVRNLRGSAERPNACRTAAIRAFSLISQSLSVMRSVRWRVSCRSRMVPASPERWGTRFGGVRRSVRARPARL